VLLGAPRVDDQSRKKIEELKALVVFLKEELEKKRFELCCYIRRAEAKQLSSEAMEDDRLRLRKGGQEKMALQKELFEKMDLVLQETLLENGVLREKLQMLGEQLMDARRQHRAISVARARSSPIQGETAGSGAMD